MGTWFIQMIDSEVFFASLLRTESLESESKKNIIQISIRTTREPHCPYLSSFFFVVFLRPSVSFRIVSYRFIFSSTSFSDSFSDYLRLSSMVWAFPLDLFGWVSYLDRGCSPWSLFRVVVLRHGRARVRESRRSENRRTRR